MIRKAIVAAIVAVVSASAAPAQDVDGFAERGPRFLLASSKPSESVVRLDVSRTPVLNRRITVAYDNVTLDEALQLVARESGLHLAYSTATIPATKRVRLRAEGITVAAALTELLIDAGVDILFSTSRKAVLIRQSDQGRQIAPAVGMVTGVVTDSATREGVGGVTIAVEGTRLSATTAADGRYALRGVPAGNRSITARRLGFVRQSRAVTVTDNESAIVDFVLVQAPTTLSEVVTTVTGDQRRVELGHVVGRINADSLVREAPVSTLSELLTARVPGLQVFQTQGTVGGRVDLQIRGPNFLNLSNQPIVIIDGVRFSTADRRPLRTNVTEHTSSLNDLNPNDIESIEVVKGPSAATLYGTDAANGVLVITTKRGRPGRTSWNVFGKATRTAIPTNNIPDIYWGWGTVRGVPNNANVSCTLARIASGECSQQDSVTVLRNPLKDPEYSMFAAKPTWEYGANVAGGQQDLRYYFSANFRDAAGPIRMPPAFATELQESLGLTALPKDWLEPNRTTNLNLRSNVTAVLDQTLDVRVNIGYVRSATSAMWAQATSPYQVAMFRLTPARLDRPYGTSFTNPMEAFAMESTDETDRFIGSVRGEWRPVGWFMTHLTLGLDRASNRRYSLIRPGDQPILAPTGEVEDGRGRQVATSADLGTAIRAQRGRLSSHTAIGGQYTRTLYDAAEARGIGLAPGQSAVPGAASIEALMGYDESVVLGGFAEQRFGLNDRLFVTGALRVDGASAFGRDFQAALYPKVGASWLVSAEPFMPRIPLLEEVRLRAALGVSSRQPPSDWARPRFVVQPMTLDDQQVNRFTNVSLGNPELRPERASEYEFGADLTALDGRLTVEATRYQRRVTDQLIQVPGPEGFSQLYHNLGLTTQGGFEASLMAQVIETRAVSLELALNHSDYSSMVEDLGPGLPLKEYIGGYAEGYPLGARFGRPVIGWEDQNGDGILVAGELMRPDTAVYMGQSSPTQTQTLSTALGLSNRRVRLSAVLDRRAGFTQVDGIYCSRGTTCREVVDMTTPLAAQATALGVLGRVANPAHFVRLREVTLAVDLPAAMTHALRLGRGTLVVSGRNLGIWSNFSGPDPEVRDPLPSSTIGSPGVGVGEAVGIPLGRVYSVRFDLRF